ncbi:hypothetical protein ABZ930_23455 [Streptomyces sp. NPDC046716]|uniref:hypothetical protein n=1 Tax=Streptomyces sp. NPDC046716 TaxID=3157093 RepID=UPI0033EC5921
MSDAQVWQAVTEQAQVWAELPLVSRFARELPYNNRESLTEVPTHLGVLEAHGAQITGSPLRAGSTVAVFSQVRLPDDERQVLTASWQEWLDAAHRIERAHRDTIAWIRSRLPGYPLLPAPHLAPHTALTTDEFSWRLTWPPQDRAAGIQFTGSPQQANQLLNASRRTATVLDRAAQNLSTTLQHSDAWQQLKATHKALDSPSRSRLIETRTKVKRLLTPQALDIHDTRMIERHNHRTAILQQEINQLDGAARAYCEAFDATDQLIEFAASDVFGQLALHGEPRRVSITDLDLTPGTVPQAHFSVSADDFSFTSGLIVRPDDPLLPEACHVTGMTWSFSHTSESRRVTARVLSGSEYMWR